MHKQPLFALMLAVAMADAFAQDPTWIDATTCKAQAGTSAPGINCSYLHGGPGVTPGQWTQTQSLTLNLPIAAGSTTVGSLDGLTKDYTLGVGEGFARPWGADDNQVALGGLNVTGGGQSYSWLDATTLAGKSGTRGSWSASAFLGSTLASDYLGYVRFTDQKQYADAAPAVVCPVASGGLATCVSGLVGAPTLQRSRVVSLQMSHPFASRAGAGASIIVSRDTVNHINGVDVPVTLWNIDKATPLWVGIDASYTSDPSASRRFGASLVISTQPFAAFVRH